MQKTSPNDEIAVSAGEAFQLKIVTALKRIPKAERQKSVKTLIETMQSLLDSAFWPLEDGQATGSDTSSNYDESAKIEIVGNSVNVAAESFISHGAPGISHNPLFQINVNKWRCDIDVDISETIKKGLRSLNPTTRAHMVRAIPATPQLSGCVVVNDEAIPEFSLGQALYAPSSSTVDKEEVDRTTLVDNSSTAASSITDTAPLKAPDINDRSISVRNARLLTSLLALDEPINRSSADALCVLLPNFPTEEGINEDHFCQSIPLFKGVLEYMNQSVYPRAGIVTDVLRKKPSRLPLSRTFLARRAQKMAGMLEGVPVKK